MKIVVIGGTGLIGSKLVQRLRDDDEEVVAASPLTGVNSVTGEGLDEAMAGASVVVDVANSPVFDDDGVLGFFRASGRNLIEAEKKAGVRHHVVLSIVGTERLQGSGYMRAKMEQENIVRTSGIPFTIVHSTQFFEFMGGIADSGMQGGRIHLSPAMMQPISSEDVADALAEVALGRPANTTVEIAGPDTASVFDVVTAYMRKSNDTREVVVDNHATYFGAVLEHMSLVPGEAARLGPTRFRTWLETVEPRN